MERQISYNWLPEEGLAMARDTFFEDAFDLRILLFVALPVYAFFIWQAHLFDPRFYTFPIFYVVLLSPLPFYFQDYRSYSRKARAMVDDGSEVGSSAFFSWDLKGLELEGEGGSIRLNWSTFAHTTETGTFIKLYGRNQRHPIYVLKRPFSDAQLEDFRLCSSVICPEGAIFL
jgi:hypothetical protein